MEVKLIEEVEKENRIQYEKNKVYKLCDNGYIFHNSIKHYFKVVGCYNEFIKAKVYFRKFGGEYKINFLCKKCYKKFKKIPSYVFEILDEECYRKSVKISVFCFDYENEYKYDRGFYNEFI